MTDKVGLVMIIKDEEAVIERALRSAIPYIETYVIVDTGSTDRTKEIIREVMVGIPGLLVDRPWVNFGVNRSEALALCDGRMKWAIMMDADDNLEGIQPPATVWARNDIDAYMIHLMHGSINHRRLQIFRTGVGWYYEGPVHETPACRKKDVVIGVFSGEMHMVTRCEGSRSRNPRKYLDDAAVLAEELRQHPENPRITYHLAQSYRDAGKPDEARRWYLAYLSLSDADKVESYLCYMNLINLTVDESEQLRYAWAGVDLLPDRLEVPYALVSKRREDRRPITQECFALVNMTHKRIPDPNQNFCIPDVYAWGFDNERTVIASTTGHVREAYESAMRCAVNAPTEEMRSAARCNMKILEKML